MTPEKEQALKEHLDAIAEILYEEIEPNQLQDLETIEKVARDQILSRVSPPICEVLITKATGTARGRKRKLKSCLGNLTITEKQGEQLGVKSHTQLSPLLSKCCLRISANVSYENAAKDIEYLTGNYVSAKTQQRLVHRTKFDKVKIENEIEELCVDGGKVRLRTPLGEACQWRDYKGICINQEVIAAFFQDNQTLTDWVNQKKLATTVTCLGDGHDGIWNIIKSIGTQEQRREILDWFHLKENLYKMGGSIKRLKKVEGLLWKGKIEEAKKLIQGVSRSQAQKFGNYLSKHSNRIIDYQYHWLNKICSIGSGAVESAIKQIDRRIKISGAQWKKENVPQVLAHRCAYLNNLI